MTQAAGWPIRRCGPGDEPAVLSLLAAAGLTTGDLEGAAMGGFLVAAGDDGLVGVAGIEAFGTEGLLRSVAVAPAARGKGLGAALVAAAEAHAMLAGLRALYLLTTTAPEFFARLGYERVDRDEAPPGIAGSAEFARLCPASAACMRKYLEVPGAGEGV